MYHSELFANVNSLWANLLTRATADAIGRKALSFSDLSFCGLFAYFCRCIGIVGTEAGGDFNLLRTDLEAVIAGGTGNMVFLADDIPHAA